MNDKPNIIYILADDMGYGDVSALNPNCPFKTKNIDSLCENGITFKDAHATSAVCTPSRYSILTGRYNWRSDLKNGVLGGYSRALIEDNRLTIANMLKENGYKTCAIGKWHLGMNFKTDETFEIAPNFAECKGVDYSGKIEKSPNYYGFDYFYGISASLDMPPYIYIENEHFTNTPTKYTEGTGKGFWRYGPTSEDFIHSEVLSHLTNKVLKKIEEYKENPFFIYFPMPAPHSPILPSNEFLGKSNTNEYGDFILMCDSMIGKIINKLKDLNIEDNTIIVFTADNGCSLIADFNELKYYGHNPSYIFRGNKSDIYEGGHRIPLIIQWKNKIKPNIKSNSIVCLSDFFATIADYLNWKIPENTAEDSISNLSIWLENKDKEVREDIIHQSIDGSLSIRKGKYKLELCPGSGGWSYPTLEDITEDMPKFQLYDLEKDISETNNIIEEHKDIAQELTNKLATYIKNGRSTKGNLCKNNGEEIWDTISWFIDYK